MLQVLVCLSLALWMLYKVNRRNIYKPGQYHFRFEEGKGLILRRPLATKGPRGRGQSQACNSEGP